ncbi:MAG TPA: metallophosphoesterase family protein [Candidatus Cloacimonadota bacterium]|nr:metallophosphoesterase family protein [Candidatus Cloacimonadota bacterium]HPT71513.1 metallophosphoesterase family protein [Candidatus Cloacimonadota bacterium]
MKRILVMSDTHGNQVFLRQVCQMEEYEVLFHLGDDYSDLNENDDLTDHKMVIRVPGVMDHVTRSGSVDLIQHVTIENWRFQLVHRQEDEEMIFPLDHVILFGHTHHPVHFFRNKILYANPGHLKSTHHRNHHASYMLITLDDNILNIEWKDHKGIIFDRYSATRAEWN